MRRLLLITFTLLAMAAASARAQDAGQDVAEGDDDNGFIINLLEDKLSTESRKIRLSGGSKACCRDRPR